MTIVFVVLFMLVVVAINVFLWKSGFLHQAEKPTTLIDYPMLDAKEKKAMFKRLIRWKEQGHLSPEEFEHFFDLCESKWGD